MDRPIKDASGKVVGYDTREADAASRRAGNAGSTAAMTSTAGLGAREKTSGPFPARKDYPSQEAYTAAIREYRAKANEETAAQRKVFQEKAGQ